MREICVEQWRSVVSHPLDNKVTGNSRQLLQKCIKNLDVFANFLLHLIFIQYLYF